MRVVVVNMTITINIVEMVENALNCENYMLRKHVVHWLIPMTI